MNKKEGSLSSKKKLKFTPKKTPESAEQLSPAAKSAKKTPKVSKNEIQCASTSKKSGIKSNSNVIRSTKSDTENHSISNNTLSKDSLNKVIKKATNSTSSSSGNQKIEKKPINVHVKDTSIPSSSTASSSNLNGKSSVKKVAGVPVKDTKISVANEDSQNKINKPIIMNLMKPTTSSVAQMASSNSDQKSSKKSESNKNLVADKIKIDKSVPNQPQNKTMKNKFISAQLGKRKSKRKFDPVRANRGVLFIKHLPHGFYEKQLEDYFNQFGKVTRLRLGRSEQSGRSKGYAFVEFRVPEVAKIAAETMNNYLMFKEVLKTSYIPPEKQKYNYFKSNVKFIQRKDGSLLLVSPKLLKIKKHVANVNKPITDEQHSRRINRAMKKLRKAEMKFKAMGIDTDFSQIMVKPKNIEKSKNTDTTDDSEDEDYIPKADDSIPDEEYDSEDDSDNDSDMQDDDVDTNNMITNSDLEDVDDDDDADTFELTEENTSQEDFYSNLEEENDSDDEEMDYANKKDFMKKEKKALAAIVNKSVLATSSDDEDFIPYVKRKSTSQSNSDSLTDQQNSSLNDTTLTTTTTSEESVDKSSSEDSDNSGEDSEEDSDDNEYKFVMNTYTADKNVNKKRKAPLKNQNLVVKKQKTINKTDDISHKNTKKKAIKPIRKMDVSAPPVNKKSLNVPKSRKDLLEKKRVEEFDRKLKTTNSFNGIQKQNKNKKIKKELKVNVTENTSKLAINDLIKSNYDFKSKNDIKLKKKQDKKSKNDKKITSQKGN